MAIAALDDIKRLIENYERHRRYYRSESFGEAQARAEFLDHLFVSLGWDVYNRNNYAPAFKQVIHEAALKVGGATKAPDYAFRVGGRRQFFLEAKKPATDITVTPEPAFQLRRYAWSAKLPISFLSNVEHLAIYDARFRPDKKDKSATARRMLLHYTQLPEHWEELVDTFSPEAIQRGSLEAFVEQVRPPAGQEVDTDFLKEIERWREILARNIALRNQDLTQREVNFAVQRTIDRIIFLRICEDRAIEEYGRLQGLQNGNSLYPRLVDLYRQADERYNSGLFHFRPEHDRPEEPDSLTVALQIDDRVLKDIVKNLYYPDSPYEFSALPADILGQIYERFLGSVIRLTPSHRAVVEEKPEVRKAGGVYYTPTYIVDYIVQQTVGKLIDGKTPKQVSKLKILDPACGSGSFLIGAYQHLLDWHRDWYVADGSGRHSEVLYQGLGGEWRLSTAERRRILLNNIFGVDIDPQAVEVTKLSLLLKVLEGENGETLNRQLQFVYKERALPDLRENIKCGNSLIGPDFYESVQMSMFDEEERYRINVFDWKTEFHEIFTGRNPGFDAVIGNPPYIRIQHMREFAPKTLDYYKKRYVSASKGNYDIYVIFAERGLELLNRQGLLGYILPHKFFNAKYGEPLRGLIAEGKHLHKVVHFGHQQVFRGASTYTCLLFLDATRSNEFEALRVDDLSSWRLSGDGAASGVLSATDIDGDSWALPVGPGAELYQRLRRQPVCLADLTRRIFQGIKTSADKIYIVEGRERSDGLVRVYSRQTESDYWLEPDLLRPLIKGGDSSRYHIEQTDRLILFPYAPTADGTVRLLPKETLESKYPKTWKYLRDNRDYLANRERGKMRGPNWYGYVYPKALDVMPQPKIFTPDLVKRASFSVDRTGDLFFTGGVAGGYGITLQPGYAEGYILGLLNSKVLEWYLRQITTWMRGGWFSCESRFISKLPIRTIDFNDPTDVKRRDRMVSLVQQMLDLHQQRDAARTDNDRKHLQRLIDTTDRQIDQLVYELYDLTEKEIALVEREMA